MQQFKWEAPDIDGLVEFLVNEKGFNEDRVRKGADKLKIALHQKQQGRLDGFFKVQPKPAGASGSSSSSPASAKKRKAEEDKKDKNKKAKGKEKAKPRGAK